MPELPEVETVVNDLNSYGICGCSVSSVYVGWQRSIAKPATPTFKRSLRDAEIQQLSRRGKYIVIHLSGDRQMLIHLRMTGKLLLQPESYTPGKHDHVVFTLSDQRKLVFNDTRKFGKITLLKKGESSPTDKLGPEPLEKKFSNKWLIDALSAKSRQMKPLLLDQSFIAGLGNIYVDEALWDARIHPERLSSSIKKEEASALHKAICKVLKRGIKNCGTTLGGSDTNFYSVAGRRGRNAGQLKVFRRTGEPCPTCGTPIERIIVGQRSTHLCPECQKNH